MSNPYALFGTSKNLEAGEGVELQYDGFSIIIHRAGGSNKMFAKVLNDKMKPHRKLIDRGLLKDDINMQILHEAYAETVVVGWKGVTDAKGKKMPYNTKNVLKLFNDLPDLFRDIMDQAGDASVFREEQEALEEKN